MTSTSATSEPIAEATASSPYTSPDGRLPRLFSTRYATRSISMAVSAIVMLQLTFYSTDVLGLPGALVGGLFLAARLVDAVTDLVIGVVIDRTKTRWGKARPYELLLIPMWACIVALFSAPDMGTVGQAIYLFVFFFLITSVCQTALYISDGVYLRRALRGEEKYAKVISRAGVFMIVAGGGISVLLPQLIALWGHEPGGWTKITLVLGIPLTIIGLMRFFLIKELPIDASDDIETHPSSRQIIMSAAKNRYAWIVAGLLMLATVASTLPSTAGTYFFLYIHGDIGLASWTSIATVIVPFTLLVFPLFVRRFGGIWFIRLTLMLAILGYGAMFLFPENLAVVVAGATLGGMSSAFTLMNGFFGLQTLVYGEWKTGVRVEGGIGSIVGFFGKVGQGLVPAIAGVTLSIVGYDGSLDVQPDHVETGIIALFSLIPLIFSAAVLGLTFLWRLDGKVERMQEDIARGILAKDSDLKL